MSSATLTADKQQAAEWLRRGQAFEGQGSPDTLAQALVCYDQVVAMLQALPATDAGRELGIAHMNRGNALQKLGRHADAVAAYNDAIACLQPCAGAGNRAALNSLGAAWMNRGHALQSSGSAAALADALRSHDEAIRLLQSLPVDENPAYRFNLAGAWLNRAQVLLGSKPADFTAARASLIEALALVEPAERGHPIAADLSLKARHALCNVLARQLPADSSAEAISEVGDAIDAALELARHWEQRQARHFRPLAFALYRFGAQFYLAHQPQFLAEFLLESLDPEQAAGAMPDAPELHTVAAEALARAQADNFNRRLAMPAGDGAARLQETAHALHTAASRRAWLQQAHLRPA